MSDFEDIYIKHLLRNISKKISQDGNTDALSEDEITIILSILDDIDTKRRDGNDLIKEKGGRRWTK